MHEEQKRSGGLGEEQEERGRQQLTALVRPKLAKKTRMQTDMVTGNSILLYPEGVVILNTTSKEILQLCDGAHTVTQIIVEMAERYQNAPVLLLEDNIKICLTHLNRFSLVIWD